MVQRIFEVVRERSDTLCNFVELPLSEIEKGSTSSKRKGKSKEKDIESSDYNSNNEEDEVLRVIYRHYATLYFVFCVDEAESELGILDLIQVFVESLDRCFENVCELDLIFHFDEIHTLLSCMVVGGYVQETSIDSIATLFSSLMKSRKASVQSSSITGGLPDINIGSASSWSEKLSRGLGRGRLGR